MNFVVDIVKEQMAIIAVSDASLLVTAVTTNSGAGSDLGSLVLGVIARLLSLPPQFVLLMEKLDYMPG